MTPKIHCPHSLHSFLLYIHFRIATRHLSFPFLITQICSQISIPMSSEVWLCSQIPTHQLVKYITCMKSIDLCSHQCVHPSFSLMLHFVTVSFDQGNFKKPIPKYFKSSFLFNIYILTILSIITCNKRWKN